jgi:hypothetical protein
MRGDCSFCWYLLNWWPSLWKRCYHVLCVTRSYHVDFSCSDFDNSSKDAHILIKHINMDQMKFILLKDVQFIWHVYDKTRKRRHFDTGSCLIQVTAWAVWLYVVLLFSWVWMIICSIHAQGDAKKIHYILLWKLTDVWFHNTGLTVLHTFHTTS